MDFIKAMVIAVIEGLTEFLPVSSTAHMIFMSSVFGIEEDNFVKMYQVSIQFGAILAVVVLYSKKFFDFKNVYFYLKLVLAVLPALVLGKLFNEKIDLILEKPIPIAIVLIIGGVVLLFIDRIFKNPSIDSEKNVSYKSALIIGFWQCLAMMPGTSRSAASIIGGMQQKLTRKAAAEFSFFLAVPTMLAVTVYSLFLKNWGTYGGEKKGYELLLHDNYLMLFLAGNMVAFLVAMLAVRFFIGIISRHGFKPWGWYRIIVGSILLSYLIFIR
ncbi:MAG: undecaprenyl-diphosphate phosphatase [Bergeyella sp.]|nr:undecaprenyl-diphosphate phosphatase [Bergeyella sp.]